MVADRPLTIRECRMSIVQRAEELYRGATASGNADVCRDVFRLLENMLGETSDETISSQCREALNKLAPMEQARLGATGGQVRRKKKARPDQGER